VVEFLNTTTNRIGALGKRKGPKKLLLGPSYGFFLR
jgi:hypothetical protein